MQQLGIFEGWHCDGWFLPSPQTVIGQTYEISGDMLASMYEKMDAPVFRTIGRGGMKLAQVFVGRCGLDLGRTRRLPAIPAWKQCTKYMEGYVGVMGVQEGLDYLLDGVAWLVHELKRQDIQFVMVGGDAELGALKQMAREKEIDDFVTFTGRVSDAFLMEVHSAADDLVNLDAVNEINDKSTMNKIIECIALGKPILQLR